MTYDWIPVDGDNAGTDRRVLILSHKPFISINYFYSHFNYLNCSGVCNKAASTVFVTISFGTRRLRSGNRLVLSPMLDISEKV